MRSADRSLSLAWACVTAVAVGWIIGGTGFLEAIEQRVEYVTALIATHDRAAERIALVPITAHDFGNQRLFAGRRPLDPAILRRLIEAVAAQEPAVIAVDVDTSPDVFAAFRTFDPGVPVVWARPARADGEIIEPSPILGFPTVEVERDLTTPSGVALVPQDSDGIVRSYVRRFHTSFNEQPSFACAIITRCTRNASCAAHLAEEVRTCDQAATDREWQIDYRVASQRAWDATAITAGRLLEGSAPPDALRDRIVLIGGSFVGSGDEAHPTPIGEATGIAVLAHVLATELRGGGANPGGTIATGILIAVETYLILAVLSAATLRQRIMGAVVVVGGIAALTSLVNEYDLSRTGHFALVILSMLVLQAGLRYVERSQEMFVDWWRGLAAPSETGPA